MEQQRGECAYNHYSSQERHFFPGRTEPTHSAQRNSNPCSFGNIDDNRPEACFLCQLDYLSGRVLYKKHKADLRPVTAANARTEKPVPELFYSTTTASIITQFVPG